MTKKIDCPYGGWIELPDEWLGEHLLRRDQVLAKTSTTGIVKNFTLAIALLENWDLPGLTGKPDKWDVAKLPAAIIVWVASVVTADFAQVFEVPKNFLRPSQIGAAAKVENAPGDLATQ